MSLEEVMDDTMFETLKALGLNDRQARVGAAGRDRQPPAGFDGLVERFQTLGLSEAAAKVAAVGRVDTESEARRGFDEAARPVESTRRVIVDGHEMSESEYIRRGPPSPQPGSVRRAGARTATPGRVPARRGVTLIENGKL